MRRGLRITLYSVGIAIVLLGLIFGTLIVGGNTDGGRRMLQRIVYKITSGSVRLTGLHGSFPSHLALDKLELVDDQGVWLTGEHITVDWTPLAYLGGRLQIDDLHVGHLDMERLPHSTSTNTKDASIPKIDAGSVAIDTLDLGEQLAGVRASLVAHGAAHLRSVRDMQFDVSVQRVGGDGDYAVHLKFDPNRMDATLELHEPASGPLENILGLPGLGALSASFNMNGLRSAEHLDLTLQAGGLQGKANGTFSLTSLVADLTFAFESAAMTPNRDLHWDRGTFQGRWQGALTAPTADGHLQLEGLRLPGGIALAGLNVNVNAAAGKGAAHAVARGTRLPGPQPELLTDDPITLDAAVQLDDPKRPVRLSLNQRLFSLRAQADTLGNARATLDLHLPDLKPFAFIIGQDIRGSADFQVQASGDLTAGHLLLDGQLKLVAGTQSWAEAVGEGAALHLSSALKDKVITLEELKFAGKSVSARATGTLSTTDIRLRWDLGITDLAAASPALAGSLQASGTLGGAPSAVNVEAQAKALLSVRGSPPGNLTAQITAKGLPSNPSGSLQAGGELDGSPLHVNVSLERGDRGAVRVIVREAGWKSARANGDVAVASSGGESRGQLHLAIAQLSDLKRLLGMEVTGSLTAGLELREDHERTHAKLQVDALDVASAGACADVHVSGEGALNAFALKADVANAKWRGEPLSVSGEGVLNLDGHDLGVATLVAKYRGQDMHLLAPARLNFTNGLAVDNLRLGAEQAELQLQGEIAPELSLRASIQKVRPALVNLFVPDLLAQGLLEAHAELHGSTHAPVGQVAITGTGIRLADDAALGLPAVDLHANAKLSGDTAEIDARLDAGSTSQFNVTGRAPVDAQGAVDLKVDGSLDVGLINPFLEGHGMHATGKLAIDATVGGSVIAPQIGGTVDLTQGSLKDYGHGTSLSDMTAHIVGSQGTLQIQSFTASAAPGKVSVTGSVGVLQAGLPVDLKIVADKAQPIVSKLVTANLDANVHLTGNARDRLDAQGTVHLNRTLIGIPNSLPPNVAVLDVRRRGKAAPVAAVKPLVIGLDITVQAPQQILVQGRGLDAEMGGELHVGGTVDEPQVNGGFDLQRGSFSLASNKLNFTAGRVGFNGVGLKTSIDPTLDFTAQTTIADVTATLHITGVADAPVFEFTSSPTLPQDEILARLLFGVNATQLSALQLAQIGAALATLSGVGGGGGGLNPLAKIQKSLGLDRLNIGSGTANTATGTENAGASIEAGRYISKRVYIAAKQSTQGTSQLEADVDLTKHLKLQTKLGNGTASVQGTTPENDPGSSIGLSYQFEY